MTADAKTKEYGASDPTLTYHVTSGSLLGSDALSGSLTRAAGESVASSPYAIQQGTLSAGTNYNLTFVGASLAITAHGIRVAAVSTTKVYGDADPTLTFVVSGLPAGLVNGDTLATAFTGSLTRALGETVAGSPYAITQGTLAPSSNYTLLNFNPGQLAITKRPATWATNPNSKYYGVVADPSPLTTGSGTNFLSDDGVTATYSRAAGNPNVGAYLMTATLSATKPGALDNYTITNAGATFTIYPDSTLITLDTRVSGTTRDCLNNQYTAILTDSVSGAGLYGVGLTLTIGTQNTTATTNTSGVATFTLTLAQSTGTKTETVSLTGGWTDGNRTAPAPASRTPFTVNADPNVGPGINADTLYTGSRFFWTTSSTSSTATLTLTATIRDKFPCGATDITKATVSFWISSNAGTSWSAVSSGQNLPVGLVDPADKGTGTASIISQYNLGKNQSLQLWVKVTVGGEYLYNGEEFDVPVTLAVPGTLNTLLAGGALKNDGASLGGPSGFPASGYLGAGDGTTSGGILADSVDFGGQVAYGKNLSNPSGQLTLLIHSFNKPDGSQDGNMHTYFVKSNAIADLALVGSPGAKTASFSSKTNVYELAGSNRNGLDGGGVMQFMFTQPGGTYKVSTSTGTKDLTCPTGPNGCASVIVYKSTGGVWFSSAWGSVGGLPQTVEKTMNTGGGISIQ